LRTLLGDAALDDVAPAAFREHNTAQMLAAELPGGGGKARARGARGRDAPTHIRKARGTQP
jgi:hypothetical protein